jgi:tRNA(Ile)-lysidine synthase
MFPAGCRVLCAVSGGADSVALLGALRLLGDEWGLSALAAAHFNHRLRGAEAEEDERFVRTLCAGWGVALYTGAADVAAEAAARGAGLEETGRALRYAFLERVAAREGFDRIATGHNADDNTETMLLHLARGTGLHGLGGIPPVRGAVVRPLLTCARRDIEIFLDEQRLPHREDASNADERFARNRVRRQVIPALRGINPRLDEAAGGLAARLRADEALLTALAREQLDALRETEAGQAVRAKGVSALPRPLSARVFRLLYAEASGGRRLTAAHGEALLALCAGDSPSARLNLPGGLVARRDYEWLRMGPPSEAAPFPLRPLAPGDTAALPWLGVALTCRAVPAAGRSGPDCFYLDPAALTGGALTLRPRQPGDRLALPGKPGGRSLKRLMIDRKIPAPLRDAWPVLADGAGVAGVPGLGADRGRMAEAGEAAWELIWAEGDTAKENGLDK